jgi:PAS domain S-box-containing protein
MIFDLGEEKIAVEALRQSQQRLKLIAESLSDAAIYGLDQDGSVSDWNAGAAQLFGLAGDEAISKSFSNLFVPEDRTVGSLENLLIKAQAQTRFETQAP